MELTCKHYLNKLWAGIKERCYSKNSTAYPKYGGRGIRVCDEWLVKNPPGTSPNLLSPGFIAFATYILEELGERPHRHTLDRINTNGNYEPGNVRWATYSVQNGNRREYTQKQRTSKFPGVCAATHNGKRKWKAYVGKVRVGFYPTEELAYEAVCAWREEKGLPLLLP